MSYARYLKKETNKKLNLHEIHRTLRTTQYARHHRVRFKHSIHLKYVYQYHDEMRLYFSILRTLPGMLERIGYT